MAGSDVEIGPEDLRALAHVSDTGLLTLFGRAMDSRAKGAIDDPLAEALVRALQPVLADSDRPMHRRLAAGRVSRKLAAYTGLRARHFDDAAIDFLHRRPGAVIVNLGCGMDTRHDRIRRRLDDARALELLDIDLPPVIELKRRILPAAAGYRPIAADVTDLGWIDALPRQRPLIVLAEGLLMYLPPAAVRELVVALRSRAPGSELVAEVVRRRWLEGWRGRLVARKLSSRFDVDRDTRFRFGIRDGHDLEAWADGIEMLREWSFMDERSPRMRGTHWMAHFDGLRRLQWVVHWRLGDPPPG